MSRTLPRAGFQFAVLALAGIATLSACRAAEVFRLNPGVEPQRYRIVCRDSSRLCEREAKETCDGEYTVLNRTANRPEQKEIEDSDLSSTGPSEGYVGWRGELIVMCGRELPKLELKRPEEAASGSPSGSAAPNEAPPKQSDAVARPRVCVPGATQACLGPGACSGAQACLLDGEGYGVCDCGQTPPPAPSAVPSARPVSSAAPAATSSVSSAVSSAVPLASARH